MDGFKDSTRMKYMNDRELVEKAARKLDPKGSVMAGEIKPLYRDREMVGKVARKLDPKKSVVVGEIKPLYRDREMVGKAARKLDPKGSVMVGDTAQYNKGGKVAAKKGVPAHSSKPMIRRSKGGLTAMPKGKC